MMHPTNKVAITEYIIGRCITLTVQRFHVESGGRDDAILLIDLQAIWFAKFLTISKD